MQELFSIKQSYGYFLFKQILKYIIFRRWENFSSFGFKRWICVSEKTESAKICGWFSACG
tara:strand:- start:192545 stop:192724 length:180 start_codon:yes stop_codon:yes gene_type:complete